MWLLIKLPTSVKLATFRCNGRHFSQLWVLQYPITRALCLWVFELHRLLHELISFVVTSSFCTWPPMSAATFGTVLRDSPVTTVPKVTSLTYRGTLCRPQADPAVDGATYVVTGMSVPLLVTYALNNSQTVLCQTSIQENSSPDYARNCVCVCHQVAYGCSCQQM